MSLRYISNNLESFTLNFVDGVKCWMNLRKTKSYHGVVMVITNKSTVIIPQHSPVALVLPVMFEISGKSKCVRCLNLEMGWFEKKQKEKRKYFGSVSVQVVYT